MILDDLAYVHETILVSYLKGRLVLKLVDNLYFDPIGQKEFYDL